MTVYFLASVMCFYWSFKYIMNRPLDLEDTLFFLSVLYVANN